MSVVVIEPQLIKTVFLQIVGLEMLFGILPISLAHLAAAGVLLLRLRDLQADPTRAHHSLRV